MRSLRWRASALGLCLFAACSKDAGLLDLTLNADPQAPPPQAFAVELTGSGGIFRSHAGKFPPDGASSLRLEYPNLPARTITFSVQTLDGSGCVVGESPAPFQVEIKAGTKVTAAASVRRSSKACGDGGGVVDVDAGDGIEAGKTGVDTGTPGVDAAFDTATVPDVPAVDLPAMDLPGPDLAGEDVSAVDASVASDVGDGVVDAPLPAGPTIVSFAANPATISAGSSTTLTAIFKTATASSVDRGIGSLTSGNGVSTGPLTATTTYKLTVTDGGGNTASQTVTVTVVPLPSITSFTALMPTIAAGTLTQLTGVFAGGTGSIDNNIGAVTSGVGVPTGVLLSTTTLTLTVTNAAGEAATKQTRVTTNAAVGPGTFIATGSMIVPRSSHTATLLANGKVLIAGGSADTAELYDPTSGTFAATGAMGTVRTVHTATLLSNGTVLLAGGMGSSSNYLSSAELYDPVSGAFSPAGSMTEPRESHTATPLPGGRVLIAGGGSPSGGYLASAEIYDPVKGAFSATGQMRNPRTYATANLLPDGHVLIVGGRNLTNVPPRGNVATVDLWDPGTGFFAPTGSLFYGRCAHTSVTLTNGRVLVVGGVGEGGPALSSELYDPAQSSFSVAGSLGGERYRHTTTLLPNGNVLVTGGDAVLPSTEVYDSNSGKFDPGGTMAAGRELHSATLLQNGRVLVVGGDLVGSAELYW